MAFLQIFHFLKLISRGFFTADCAGILKPFGWERDSIGMSSAQRKRYKIQDGGHEKSEVQKNHAAGTIPGSILPEGMQPIEDYPIPFFDARTDECRITSSGFNVVF
jgi:hypothetical protein